MLILLDIDGVMVPAKSWKAPELLSDDFYAFSPKATVALQSLISDKDIVVLTTSHRSRFTINEWHNIFKNRGINISNIEILPENIHNLSRKDEIIKWLNVNNIENDFLIIDDDNSLHDLSFELKRNLIKTRPLVGLTSEDIASISKIPQWAPQVAKRI